MQPMDESDPQVLAQFFACMSEMVKPFVHRAVEGEREGLAMIDAEMAKGMRLRLEVTIGAQGPIGVELWAVNPDGAEKLSEMPAPAGGTPFRLAPT